MRILCTTVALVAVAGACGSSSKDKERALALLEERQFCEGTRKTFAMNLPTVGEPGGLESRTVAALMDSVLFCTAATEHEAVRQTMKELERASPECFKQPLDQVAQLRAQRRLLQLLQRGSPAHATGARPRPKEKQRLCLGLLRLFERGRRAAENPRPNDPDRVISMMPNALGYATHFCATEKDRSAPHTSPLPGDDAGVARPLVARLDWAEHLLRSAELCAPPAKSSSNADIKRERQGLDLMIEILRRGSADSKLRD